MAGREGLGSRASSSAAAISMPGVQMPHWVAPPRTKASCSRAIVRVGGEAFDGGDPAIRRPGPSGTRQAQTWAPSSSTVQAPQSPASQPTLVPVRPSSSRSTRLSRVASGEVAVTLRPFSRNAMPRLDGARPHAAAISRRRRAGRGGPARGRRAGDRHRSPGHRRSARARRDRQGSRLLRRLQACRPCRRASRSWSRRATAEQAPTAIRRSAMRPASSSVTVEATMAIEMTR